MEKYNLNKIIADNLDKAKFQSKSKPSLPTNGWLDAYKSGGYISDDAKATQFGQYADGGDPNKPYHPITNPDGYRPSNTLERIQKLPNKEKRYEPTDAVKDLKSTLSAISLANIGNPFIQYLTQVAGGTGDLYTAAKYAADQNWKKAGEDALQGVLGFIPYAKAVPGMKIGTDYFTKGAKLFNTWLKRAHGASDIKTITESPIPNYPIHKMGGGMFPEYHSYTPPRMNNGGDISIPDLNADKWLTKYALGGEPGDDQTVLKTKTVGEIRTPLNSKNLRPIYKFKSRNKYDREDINDTSCTDPNGPGCSYQATRNAMNITGLPIESYAPANAAYRDAVAERTGLQNVFNQEGEQKKYANSGNPGWKYPTTEDFNKWKAGDIVVLDAPGADYFGYNAPSGFTEKDNSGASHNGVVVGFTENGRPVIKHGYAKGEKGKGVAITEILGKDNRVTNLGHGRYAVKSVWRPKEITDDNNIESVRYIKDTAKEQASRKASTDYPVSFDLKNTSEENLINELPVAASFSGANTRLSTKNNIVNLFNDKNLDKDLQYKFGIDAKTLQNLKPVVYGVAGQETNFNDVDNPLAATKDIPGNLLNKSNSKGLFQIKYDSLTDDERKLLNIKSPNDLLDNKKAYKAAIVLMHNAYQRMNKEVDEGTHPGLKEADPYFRAAYYYNSPMRATSTAKEWGKGSNPVTFYDPTTWLNPFHSRDRDLFSEPMKNYVEKAELRMDKGSYPYKLMQKASDLLMDNSSEGKVESLEPVVVRSIKGNKKIKLYN